MNPSEDQHGSTVNAIDETIRTEFAGEVDPEGDVASVSRDLLSASPETPVHFGNETTDALKDGENITPNDPEADAMSLRYDDDREAVLNATVARIRSSLADEEIITPRTPEEQAAFLAKSTLNRIALKHREDILVTGFTYDETTYADPSKIQLRSEDKGTNLEIHPVKPIEEKEKKYSVNPDHPDFPDLAQLEEQGKYEDHEQIYLFVKEGDDGKPTYEVRVRKVTNSDGSETYTGAIKCGGHEQRTECPFEMNKELYDAFSANVADGYRILKKRRYFVDETDDWEMTIDKTELEDGSIDLSSETEFNPAFYDQHVARANPDQKGTWQAPKWTTKERDKRWRMRNVAQKGWTLPEEG